MHPLEADDFARNRHVRTQLIEACAVDGLCAVKSLQLHVFQISVKAKLPQVVDSAAVKLGIFGLEKGHS